MSSANTTPCIDKAVTLILEFLNGQTNPCSEKQMTKMVRCRKKYKVAALRMLVHDGRVHRTGLGKKGCVFLYSIGAMALRPQPTTEFEEITI